MEPLLIEKIQEIARDNLSGASEISRNCLESLKSFSEITGFQGGEEFFRGLLYYCAVLIKAQPFMASNIRLLSSVINKSNFLQEEKDNAALLSKFNEIVAIHVSENLKRDSDLAAAGMQVIPDGARIITYSSSGSVTSALIKTKEAGKDFSVIVSEGRPMLEGKKIAFKLAEKGVPVKLVIDAALPHYVRKTDMVMVGADWIADDYFINKIGTDALARVASVEEIPFYVIATSNKILSESFKLEIEDSHPVSEVLDEEIKGITVENPYFEEISTEFVTNFITEEGFLTIEDINNIIANTTINSDLSLLF